MPMLPDPNTPIAALDLPPASTRVADVLSRMVVFLYGIMEPVNKARAILAGYSPRTHSMGVYLTAQIAGQRPFWEWRIHYSMRPPRDPDLPELVAQLDAFREKWLPVVTRVAAKPAQPLDRLELQDLLQDPVDKPSRVWRAKAWVSIVERLRDVPLDFYQSAWAELVSEGIEDELPHFHKTLKTVQTFIQGAPLERAELQDLVRAREETAQSARDWLSDRHTELKAHLDEESCALLGLGEQAPACSPPIPVVEMLAWRGVQN